MIHYVAMVIISVKRWVICTRKVKEL